MEQFLPKCAARSVELATGTILLAKTFMPEPAYSHSVILIVHHDEVGTTGIILNQQCSIAVSEAMDTIQLHEPLYYGGPIESNLVTFVHNVPQFPGAIKLGNGLYWGGDHEYLNNFVKNSDSDEHIRFFAGLVSWHNGELEYEISNNYWWVTTVDPAEFFNRQIADMHTYALIRDKNIMGAFGNIPGPFMN